MISFTLETALAVSETGGVFFTSGTLVFTSGTVVVAIRISLALKYLDYTRAWQAVGIVISLSLPTPIPNYWMSGFPATIPPATLANWSIMLPLGPSSELRIARLRPASLYVVDSPNGLGNCRGGL